MNLTNYYKERLNRNFRVLNCSHQDLDGAGSSIVVRNVFKNVEFVPLKYGDVNDFLKDLDYSKYDLVLLTDISPESEEAFNYSDKIFLLDHHSSGVKYHKPEVGRICIEGKSACLLCKNFFENLFNLDLSYLNELCEYINLYDMWIDDPKFPIAWCYNEIFFYLHFDSFIKRFKNGDTKFNDVEIKFILDRKKLLTKTYNETNVYDLDSIKAGFFIGGMFLNDICHKLMHEKDYEVIMCVNAKSNSCSIRTKSETLHLGDMLQEIGLGGGHAQAGAFKLKEYDDVQEKIEKVEQYIFKNFPEIRRQKSLKVDNGF